MAKNKKHSLPKGINTPWPGNPAGTLSGRAPSAVRLAKPTGTDPGNPHYGIKNTTKKHKSAISQPTSFKTPSGQGLLSSKAKRQVG